MGRLVVMLDGELSGDVVNAAQVQPVMVTTVELLLHGTDLVDDPELRRGLVSLWVAEADTAGLDIDCLRPYGDGECDSPGCGAWRMCTLAERTSSCACLSVRTRWCSCGRNSPRTPMNQTAASTPVVRWYPLLVAAVSVGIANSVIFALLSNLQDKYGFSDTGLGLIAGSGFFVGLIGQALLAPLVDRGHAKTLSNT